MTCFLCLFYGHTYAGDEPRSLNFTYTCYLTNISKGAALLDVWIPVPISDDRQTVKLLSVNGKKGTFNNDIKYGNKLYYIRYYPQKEELADTIKITFTYELTIREKSVPEAKQLASLEKVKPGDGMNVYLAPNRLIPLGGPITELKNSMQLPEQPILAARKVYDNLITRMVYNYQAPGAGLGDAVWACSSKTGDCSDYHSVFIGICRASGIPADHEFGFPLRPNQPNRMVKYWHCWAKFWVQGPGWITIDASEADKHPESKEYLFGTLSNDYLTISHGRDVILEPAQKGEPLNIFADPYAEVDGQPITTIGWFGLFNENK